MLKRILAAFGIATASATPPSAQSSDGPYKESVPNFIYQLLFCDRPELYAKQQAGTPQSPWSILFHEPPDLDAIARLAEDSSQESRVRMLAFNKLRAAGRAVPKKVCLGTIIEVRLPGGLDTLAVFADGGARYINQSGRMVVVEGKPNPFDNEIAKVIEGSVPIVAAIGPWDKDRLPAPKQGNLRMTFLVSDGLYFGEGPMGAMQRNQMAAPLIAAGTTLLLKLVNKTTDSKPDGAATDKKP